MIDPQDSRGIDDWEPSRVGLASDEYRFGFPTVIYRTPSRLVEECEKAFDAGLFLAALGLVVTIPDVCARIEGSDYRKWSEKYLGLTNDGREMSRDRLKSKKQEDVDKGLATMEERGVFTASDLYQLRCAVLHAGSSSIDDAAKGSIYSPFRVIDVCVQGDARSIIARFGHVGEGVDVLEGCAYDCSIKLEGLISLMAKGVRRFIDEDPSRDREYFAGEGLDRRGIVDYRSISRSTGR